MKQYLLLSLISIISILLCSCTNLQTEVNFEQNIATLNSQVDELIADNIKPYVHITYRDKEIHKERIEQQEKTKFIKNLIDNNIDVISIVPEKPTLEEIFYEV